MNICFFHSSMRAGGIEREIALLANLYVQNGDVISIVTLSEEESFYPLSTKIKFYKSNLESNTRGKYRAILNNIARIAFLRKCLKELNPDVLLTFSANTELIGFFAKGKQTKLIGAEKANPHQYSTGFWDRNTRKISLLCDGFLFQTKRAATCYPIMVQKKAFVIQNGLDITICKKADSLWKERKNICSVGRMDANKGIDDVIRAFSLVNRELPDIVLDLYGDGPMRAQLENLAKSLGIADKVVFHGRCNTMIEEYSSHKIFLMMSHSEGFPNVLLEAMSCGCLCISSNCDFGPFELIKNGQNGVLVDVGDYQTAAQKVIYYLQNEEEMQKISNDAKTVRETNDITKIGMENRNYFLKVLNH